MLNVVLFGEDFGHESFVVPLIRRIALDCSVDVSIRVQNADGGRPRLFGQLDAFIKRRVDARESGAVELVVIVTDANCYGLNSWKQLIMKRCAPLTAILPTSIVAVIPDPHIERWMLLDGRAFKAVLGKGCQAPDDKCDRGKYKELLAAAIEDTGTYPLLGGMEFAAGIIEHANLSRMMTADPSFSAAVSELRRRMCPKDKPASSVTP